MSQEFYDKDDDKVVDIDLDKLKKRTSKFVPMLFLLIVAILLFVNSFYTVDTKEDAVILRLGKYKTTVESAGPHFKVPFIDVVKKVDVEKIYNMEYGFRTVQQGTEFSEPVYEEVPGEASVIVDGSNNNASIALIELIIQYKVDDPFNYLFKVDDPVGTLRLALEDVVRSKVQGFTLEDAKTQKEVIDEEVLPALQKKIESYNTGIVITKVKTQNVEFLPSVEEAFKQKENANQYKNGKVEDGEKYENTVVPQAEAEARAIVEDANAYSATVKAAAKAEVAQFLALYEEFSKNEDILKERYYLDAMREFLANNKVIIDFTENENFLKMFNTNSTQGFN
jgi:membrane protease subunit HflK